MADKTVAIGGDDLFSMDSHFNVQTSSAPTEYKSAMIKDADGNMECETSALDGITQVEQTWSYCNAVPAIGTDLGTIATKFGDVHGSYLLDELTIEFSAGQYATGSMRGHNHAANAHAAGLTNGYADVSAAIPASAGFGVPTLTGVTLGSNATPISLSISFAFESHPDAVDANGAHFVGKHLTCKATASAVYLGTPSTIELVTGWTTDKVSTLPNTSNADFDQSVWEGHRYFDLATS